MTTRTSRRRALDKALSLLIPGAPFADMEAIRQAAAAPHFRSLPPSVAAWLTIVSHIRHRHTDYDLLLEQGYDRESARHFSAEEINAALTEWRAIRLVDPGAEGDAL
jgi:hypothetical protein